MNRASFVLGSFFAFVLATGAAFGAPVTVTGGWFRQLPSNLPAGGYFTLRNGTAKTLTLNDADTPACGMLMLHKSDESNGMASMSDITSIHVPAGGALAFAPGGYHLMCMDPTALLKQGTSVPVTLHFADGLKITTPFAVRSATGK